MIGDICAFGASSGSWGDDANEGFQGPRGGREVLSGVCEYRCLGVLD